MSLNSAVPKYAFPLLCAGLLLTAPVLAAPKPPVPSHATAAADSTSAVAVVSKLLTLRVKNNFAGMYGLLSASSQKHIPRKEFLAGSPQSKEQLAQMTPELRGIYALLADTHNALGYTFAVVGPDPTNPSVVLVHAFPKPAPGVVPATLKIDTVMEKVTGKTSRRTVDAFGSVGRVIKQMQDKQAAPADTLPADTPPAAPMTDTPPTNAPAAP